MTSENVASHGDGLTPYDLLERDLRATNRAVRELIDILRESYEWRVEARGATSPAVQRARRNGAHREAIQHGALKAKALNEVLD